MPFESYKQTNSDEKIESEKTTESSEDAYVAAEMIQIDLMKQMLGKEATQDEKINWVAKNAESFREIFSANENQFVEMYRNENSRKDIIEIFKNLLDKEKGKKPTIH